MYKVSAREWHAVCMKAHRDRVFTHIDTLTTHTYNFCGSCLKWHWLARIRNTIVFGFGS